MADLHIVAPRLDNLTPAQLEARSKGGKAKKSRRGSDKEKGPFPTGGRRERRVATIGKIHRREPSRVERKAGGSRKES